MVKITRRVTVNAPVEEVFAYLTDPSNLLEIWPSLLEVTDVQQLSEVIGSSYRWVYKMAGMRFRGKSEVVEYVANEAVTVKDSGEGKLEAVRRSTFEPANGGTKLTWETEYRIPIPLLGRLAEAVIVKLTENEADAWNSNLKAGLETCE